MSADRHPSADLTHSEATSDASPRLSGQGSPSDAHQSPVRIKRRKHPSISENDSAKNQLFYFVDSNSSSREKRAHVMRHHVQEKRRQRKHSHPRRDHDKILGRSLHYFPWQQKTLDLEEDDFDFNEPIGPPESPDRTESADDKSLVPAGFPMLKSASFPTDDPRPVSPVSLLDASRKDPFDSYPVFCSKADLELADYWTNRLTYWSGQNKYIKNQIFRTAMSHSLAFQAVILTYCARWKLQLYNLTSSNEAETHLGQVTKDIDKALKGSLPINADSLAMAMTGMALQEERFGTKEKARGYADQAVQILRSRAGASNAVEVFLHYVRYLMIPPPNPSGGGEGQQWLTTFLRGAEELMLEHNTKAYLSSVPQRQSAFQMDSPLFPLLSSGPRPSQIPEGSRMYVVRNSPTQELTRTAALIYITATLWDFQDSQSKTGRFLNHLCAIAKEHQLDRYPACETFVWLLLEESYDLDLKDPERGWSTGELLKMHKQLRPDLQFQFNEILFSLLMLMPPIRGIDTFEEEICLSSDTSDL
ncbi:hypothetical protein P170DRAFT_407904 [Aspergillus steynii IBT 23096]|uniref:Uncharacterized protein n=1 Tax=Aspergillus steynii IBT 23096 TaxID=1392250 RepID=A0A2I2G7Y7_9EURO|nr:uncharacterized protein P170DRAFT_407904 [Aspergillus steynii IBT 23096]PLB48999.1 hypothetical protein P170DRAFT_407904 [Aspergillus steynii IBT 23096]